MLDLLSNILSMLEAKNNAEAELEKGGAYKKNVYGNQKLYLKKKGCNFYNRSELLIRFDMPFSHPQCIH